jgi:DNA-binding response OmpR family regulator
MSRGSTVREHESDATPSSVNGGQNDARTARNACCHPYAGDVNAPTVLVVEDDESIGRGLMGALESQGYDTRWVTTAGEALDAFGSDSPELVLLDLGLPDVDGIEVCRQLRAGDAGLPIVILTARHEEIDVVLGLDAGADDYVTKPFR